MIYSRYIECSQETYHSLTKKRFWTYVHDRGDTLTRLKVFTQVDARLLRLRISQRGTPAACASRLEFLSRYSRWGTPGRTALRSVLTEVFRLYGFDEGEIRQEHLWLRKNLLPNYSSWTLSRETDSLVGRHVRKSVFHVERRLRKCKRGMVSPLSFPEARPFPGLMTDPGQWVRVFEINEQDVGEQYTIGLTMPNRRRTLEA